MAPWPPSSLHGHRRHSGSQTSSPGAAAVTARSRSTLTIGDVAGYGTSIEVPAVYDQLSRALLRAAQRRGRALDLEVRFRKRSSPSPGWTSWELTADGHSVHVAAWARQIERELPVVAEGYTGAGSGRAAVRLAGSLVARFIEFCVGGMLEAVPDRVVLHRQDDARVFWPLLDPPDLGHDLAARLTLADELIARWLVGDLPDETGIEEIHTAIEIVLRRVLDAGERVPFPDLIRTAAERELITQEDHDVLVDLNKRRVQIKHHGGVIPPDAETETASTLNASMRVLDRIERCLNRGPSIPPCPSREGSSP